MRKFAFALAALAGLGTLASTPASATYYGYGYGYRHYAPRVVCHLVPVTVYGYYGYQVQYRRVCRTAY
jgi:hypothetical protein